MSKIYTKTGDKGKTSLGSGVRVLKSDIQVESYASCDELNSYIGIVISEVEFSKRTYKKNFLFILNILQNDLFCIGTYLSNLKQKTYIAHLAPQTELLEKEIDEMTRELKQLTYFILPGGAKVWAHLQYARVLSRRCERRVVALSQKKKVDESVLQYLNRISDLLFTMSRFANLKDRKKETAWRID